MHKTVKCFASKLYTVYKEQVHILGYIGILSILYAIYTHVSTFVDAANANTLSSAKHDAQISKLQDWRETTDVSLAQIQQEVHDIHTYLLGKR